MTKTKRSAILFAILAAALFGISAPFAKLLLVKIPPTLMAALLYFGAGMGMVLINSFRRLGRYERTEARLSRKEMPYIISMILLDIAAPILLMIALTLTTSANASLLNNFEIVATSLIALLFFKEAIGRRLWLAIALITLSTMILSIEDASSFKFSIGSIFVILACLCWGLENNCTRMLSLKDPLQIVGIKGLGSGTGSLLIALLLKQNSTDILYIGLALLLGFFAYGLSIYFYIRAQRELGAARTSAYYAVAPFIGVILSIMIFRQKITAAFVAALLIMIVGAYFAAIEYHRHYHVHEAVTHTHRHTHDDQHHTHQHEKGKIDAGEDTSDEDHSHVHTHESTEHTHKHTPDLHHTHRH
jgi:drug/metabolite transporter (DMT)-like permease